MSILTTIQKNVDYWYRKLFDDKQRGAVDGILDSWSALKDIFILPIIDGPPGTGKTTVGAVACAKYLTSGAGNEIVYMCHTNIACERAQRVFYDLGFTFCPPGVVALDDPIYVARIYAHRIPQNWVGGVVGMPGGTKPSYMDATYLKRHNVILCTLDSAGKLRDLRDSPKIVIDEFSQVNPPHFFAAVERICRGAKNPDGFALLGDPIQLPVVTTQPALRPDIASFILSKKPHPTHELETQHRMHEHICEAVNMIRAQVYRAHPLITAPRLKNRTMVRLGYGWDAKSATADFRKIVDPNYPLVLINTDTTGPEEQSLGESWQNLGEAELAVEIAKQINGSYTDGERAEMIRILTPYGAQDELLSEKLANKLGQPAADWSMTIHKAQGQEFPCVIISFVRNNSTGKIGFLEEDEFRAQTYVAVSRAKAKLIILMSFKTFLGHSHADFEAFFDSPHALKVKKCPSS